MHQTELLNQVIMPSPAELSQSPPEFQLAGCQWVVFDAVGTLIDPEPSVAVAYHSIGTQYGARFGVAEVSQRFRQAFRTSERNGVTGVPDIHEPWVTSDEIELARWRWIVREVFPDIQDHESCFRDLWDHFANPSHWRCFDDVRESLSQLASAGYRLAMASNFDGRLHSVCDGLPELAPIEQRIVSATVGFRKPAPEFFAELVRVCDCEPGQILMIGDSPENDVLAPRRAGLQALHLDRDPPDSSTGQLRSLRELTRKIAMPGFS